MEDFGSWDTAPDDFCRAKVAKCDLFICIAGPLYGSRSPAGQSYTEREFEAAIDHGKTCLVFMTAEDFPLAANLIESDEDRKCQLAFRQRIAEGRIITRFSTADQASVQVVQSIRNWEASQAASTPTEATLLVSQIKSVSYRVAVLNRSTMVTDDEVKTAVAALQTQIHRDFAPAWGIDAELAFVAKDSEPAPGSWWLVVEDNSEFAGAVAYHTLTSEGLPRVKISVANAKQANWEWTMAASHDLMERLANPMLNLTVFVAADNGTSGKLYVREICDPVSSPEYTYKIDGVVVSNFVFPSWFESFRKKGSSQFDYGNYLTSPFELGAGAYMTTFDVRDGSGWRPVFTLVSSNRKRPSLRPLQKRSANPKAESLRNPYSGSCQPPISAASSRASGGPQVPHS
jgi:hypothetical protein